MKKVLIIEDDLLILQAYIDGLKAQDFDAVGALSGAEGLKMIEENIPDVIILDLMLPDFSGEEILKIMGEKGLLEKIPVIVSSNRAGTENINNCINKLGAKDYLIKSDCSLEEVVRRINRVLAKS